MHFWKYLLMLLFWFGMSLNSAAKLCIFKMTNPVTPKKRAGFVGVRMCRKMGNLHGK